MRLLRRSFLALAVSVFAWISIPVKAGAAAAPSSMVVGVIKASNVRGDVRKVVLADSSEVPLRNGDTLSQNHLIVTGAGESSAVLVFANGSTVRVGNQSRLEIREFLMDPLDADIGSVAALTREPTKSRTDLRLEFGEVVGNVKTLNHAEGSTFSVSTPAGAAGIRGTTFRIVFRPSGNGQAFNFQLSTSEGVVIFEGNASLGRTEVPVPVGREVALTAQIDPATNSVVVSNPGGRADGGPASVPMSQEAAAALQEATVQILQVQARTPFTRIELQNQPAPPGGPPADRPPPSGQPGQGGPNSANPNSSTAPGQQNPARPASLPPRTTPGDGR